MPQTPPIDLPVAPQWFVADFFNEVWDLLKKSARTPEQAETMVSAAHASLAHWRN